MLYIIGLGLGDEKDITVRGYEAIQSCSKIYLEYYTSILGCSQQKLEAFYKKPILLADREFVEEKVEDMLICAQQEDVAFLVVGDPFGATTHTDLYLRCVELKTPVTIIHNASIMNAIGSCGLSLYTFGETVSLVFFTETWKPDSIYDKIKSNQQHGLHTLVLLDIKVKEPNIEMLARGKKVYEAPRFMSVGVAVEQLLELERLRGENVLPPTLVAVGLARIGQPCQCIRAGPLCALQSFDFGPPLHSLIIPAPTLHLMEQQMLDQFRLPHAP